MTFESPPVAGRRGAVELSVPAVSERLSTVGAVATDLAMREDMTLDDVADLRLAVGEACAALISVAERSASLHCVFRATGEYVEMLARVRGRDAVPGHDNGFQRHVLRVLTDRVEWTAEPSGDPLTGPLVGIRLRKNV